MSNISQVDTGIMVLVIAGMLSLLISPATASAQVTIDPIPADLSTGMIVTITGTTALPADSILHYVFSAEDQNEDGLKYGEYSGVEGTAHILAGTWRVDILTKGYAPGDYVFSIGPAGSGDTVSAQIKLVPRTGPPTVEPTSAGQDLLYKTPVYASPGSRLEVSISPDLAARKGSFAKGSPVSITGTATPGGPVGIWIISASPKSDYSSYREVSADGSGRFECVIPGSITSALRSGQFFIYVVDGAGAFMEHFPTGDPKSISSEKTLEVILNINEGENPYQKFMLLVEEPFINIDEIPYSARGTLLEIKGSTNLNSGEVLEIEMATPDVDRLQQSVHSIPGITVGDGENGFGIWSGTVDTTDFAPGEYVIRVHGGRTAAATMMVIYDPLYDVETSNDNLTVMVYDVNPGTGEVVTATEAGKNGSWTVPAMLAVAGLAGCGGIGIIIYAMTKR